MWLLRAPALARPRDSFRQNFRAVFRDPRGLPGVLYLFRGCVLSLRLTPSFPLRGLSLSLFYHSVSAPERPEDAAGHRKAAQLLPGAGVVSGHCINAVRPHLNPSARADPCKHLRFGSPTFFSDTDLEDLYKDSTFPFEKRKEFGL